MSPPVRGLFVGRFQPFHAGHLAAFRWIRARAPDDELIVAVGSAEQSYTVENPFTAGERVEMILRALDAAKIDRVLPIPVADIHRHALWVGYLEGLLPPFDRIYTTNPLTQLLFERARYSVERPPLVDRPRLEGRKIRALLAAGRPLGDRVPPAVGAYLATIGAAGRLALLGGRPGGRGAPRT